MNAQTKDYRGTALGVLAFSPFVLALVAMWAVSPIGVFLGFASLIIPCCLAYLCMAIFICLTASSCGPLCTRWLLPGGLYGIVVLLVGVFGGEAIWTGILLCLTPDDTFNMLHFKEIPDLMSLCAHFGFVPSFVMGVAGALICRLSSSPADA